MPIQYTYISVIFNLDQLANYKEKGHNTYTNNILNLCIYLMPLTDTKQQKAQGECHEG